MSDNPLASILEMDGEERYDYFLDAVVEERELWILVNGDNQFLKIVSEEDGVGYLPVWPAEDFAADYAGPSGDLSPKAISLPDFFKKWVPGLSRDGLEVGVFPGADSELWITQPEELKQDLQDVLSGSF
ncbi:MULTISPECIES: DUF2750 domain-containing protein [Marinobacter]|uniref:DUF2750 domain-containing protein n=1 Tax=Marinobacter TaxID=2742 RepID=UPI0002D8F071|nr:MULTISPECIES: DUF2750 domain-containing protein [Marinobacter]MCS5562296.1 DUF2750 domain-containing protein [Marinobacter nauticus]MEC8897914.1 DUF2750 domain-containing protein [Pseudomonadota bacterium]MEC9039799.1 DUF2750 domain-containing protein [Pseudomonadota bacterium]